MTRTLLAGVTLLAGLAGFLESVAAQEPRERAVADLMEGIAPVVREACEADEFSGAVLVAEGEDILYAHACGEASRRFNVPNNVRTRFNLGSMNKMFTAVAVLQLVERGLVSLDDPISAYVDETWLPRSVTDRITVHDLLAHTSGLGSYFNQTFFESSRARFREVEDFKPLVRGEEPAFEPGTDWAYSNTGMLLLGVVIESATGEDYFDYIRTNIYGLAGMESSDSYDMDRPVENLAIGYEPLEDGGGYRNNLFLHVIRGGPAGGGFSTVGDLHRFALALRSGALVNEASRELLWTDHAGANYGYGFALRRVRGLGPTVGHSGGFPGISSTMDIFLENDLVVVVMSNYGGASSTLVRRIYDRIGDGDSGVH